MGHTHYWKIHNDQCQGAYNLAKEEMRAFMHYGIVKHKIIIDIIKENDPISEEPLDMICFNGVEDEACETFYLPELVADVFNDSFPFCKTSEREYDPIVVGCLFILKKYLATAVTIRSDGYSHKSINPDNDDYCDQSIKDAYTMFKEFQAICPTGWKSGGILPLFK